MRRFVSIGTLILGALAASVCFAAEPPPQGILARAKEAQGGSAWDRVECLRSFVHLETAGLAGPLEIVEDLKHGANLSRSMPRQTWATCWKANPARGSA